MKLFGRVIALPVDERAELLNEAPTRVRERVVAMLDADTSAHPLDGAGADLVASLTDDDHAVPPMRGHYRVIRVIGEGGAGVVYEAEQLSPRRHVALKALRRGLTSPSALRRFQTEAHILARLHHPNIAAVYEAGIADVDRPHEAFIAMELVDGLPVTEHARLHRLGIEDRLSIFLEICDALAHAHLRAVIHRDLKPRNILVDPAGRPKVLDFGVARVSDPEFAAHATATQQGQIIGTLMYMSPEQAAGHVDDVDVRADVYALGAVLFELLTDEPPFDLDGLAFPDAVLHVRSNRPRPAGQIRPELRGDLETIIGRAMDPVSDRRYQSVAALAEDVRRHLDGRPIEARRDSTLYVLSRTARRHIRPISLSLVAAALLIAFAVVPATQAHRNSGLNERLRDELRLGRIDQGRAESAAFNGAGAESLIWPELIAQPDSRPARWALWELAMHHHCRWARSLPPGLTKVSLSPDAGHIAVGANDATIRILSASNGNVLAASEPDASGAVIALGFQSPDVIVSLHAGGDLVRWRMEDDLLERDGAWRLSESPVSTGAFSADHVVLANRDRDVTIWSCRDDALVSTWQVGADVTALTIDPPARRLAVGLAGGDIETRAIDGSLLERDAQETRIVACLEFTSGGDLLVGALESVDQGWGVITPDGTLLARTRGKVLSMHHDAATGALLSTDYRGAMLVGADRRDVAYAVSELVDTARLGPHVVTIEDDTVRLWDLQLPGLRSVGAHQSWVFSVDVDSSSFLTASGDHSVSLWRRHNGSNVDTIRLPERVRSRMAIFTPDGSTFAVACSDARIRLYDAGTRDLVWMSDPLPGEVYAIDVSPDGDRLVAASYSRTLSILDLSERVLVAQSDDLATPPRSVVWSPDGRRLYSSGDPAGVIVWDARSLTRIDLLETESEPWSIALSPDGHTLATGTFAPTAEFFDIQTGAHRVGNARHHIVAAGIAFAPDGTLVASGGDDGSIKLWDPATGHMLASLDRPWGQIPGVTFIDAWTLAWGCSSGRFEVLDLRAGFECVAGLLPDALDRFGAPSDATRNLEAWAAGIGDAATVP